MMTLQDVQNDFDLTNVIDWEMTPEDAVTLYLEWGNNWARSNYVIRGKDDVAHYFVVNTWETPPVVYLIRRSSEEAVELARTEMPDAIRDAFMESIGHNKGVYSTEGVVRDWLKAELGAA